MMDNRFLTLLLLFSVFCILSQVSLAKGIEKGQAINFLSNYGYLPRSDLETGQIRSYDEVREAIMNMQRIAKIPVTGELDKVTLEKMATPRCGMSDMEVHLSRRAKRYILAPSKWQKKELTWRLEKGSTDLPDHIVKKTLKQAMKIWSDTTQLTFIELPHKTNVDMKISFGSGYHGDSYPFDKKGGVLAHAFYPGTGWGGDLHFDESEKWTVGSYEGQNLLYVAVHELGHALGLRHSDVENSIMYPYSRGYDPNLKLYPDDIFGIQALYGKPIHSKPRPTSPTHTTRKTTTTTTIAPPTTTTSPPEPRGHCPAKIDAISVIRGETFIFSGTQYWRYNYYGKVGDEPRAVREFWRLPEDVEKVDAVYVRPYSGNYKIVFFAGRRLFEFDGTYLTNVKTLQDIGFPWDVDHIDAAFVWGLNDMTYLVSGRMYWRYDDVTQRVFKDYPRDMSMWQGVPVPVDAAFSSRDRYGIQRTYFFKGRDFYEVDDKVMRVKTYQTPPTVQFWSECFAALREGAWKSAATRTQSMSILLGTVITLLTSIIIQN